jgi:hypothetical protein
MKISSARQDQVEAMSRVAIWRPSDRARCLGPERMPPTCTEGERNFAVNAHHFGRLTRTLGTSASRRQVLGALLAATFVPQLVAAHGAAMQDATCSCQELPCFLRTWGGQGSAPGQVDEPGDVAVAPEGTVYVTDTGNNRIQYFDAAGTYLGQWGSESGSIGSAEGEFWHPRGIAVAPDGLTIYVADTNNYRIQAFHVASCVATERPSATPLP